MTPWCSYECMVRVDDATRNTACGTLQSAWSETRSNASQGLLLIDTLAFRIRTVLSRCCYRCFRIAKCEGAARMEGTMVPHVQHPRPPSKRQRFLRNFRRLQRVRTFQCQQSGHLLLLRKRLGNHVYRTVIVMEDKSVGKVKHGVFFLFGSDDGQRGKHRDDGGRKANPGST